MSSDDEKQTESSAKKRKVGAGYELPEPTTVGGWFFVKTDKAAAFNAKNGKVNMFDADIVKDSLIEYSKAHNGLMKADNTTVSYHEIIEGEAVTEAFVYSQMAQMKKLSASSTIRQGAWFFIY